MVRFQRQSATRPAWFTQQPSAAHHRRGVTDDGTARGLGHRAMEPLKLDSRWCIYIFVGNATKQVFCKVVCILGLPC